jgi:hypothetical protein
MAETRAKPKNLSRSILVFSLRRLDRVAHFIFRKMRGV